MIVELGIKLDKNLEYCDKLLKDNGFDNDFNCETRDIYFSNTNLDGLTENEIKNKCIRIRNVSFKDGYKVENNQIKELNIDVIKEDEFEELENKLINYGYKKIFDTKKKDHHYFKEGVNSKIQLQEIDNIGLVLYYDNPSYCNLSLDEQRKKLIDELNTYGFNFNHDILGIDKLRTLYYGKEMFSENQNG